MFKIGTIMDLSRNVKLMKFISDFVEYVIYNYSTKIKLNSCENETLKVHEIWSEL